MRIESRGSVLFGLLPLLFGWHLAGGDTWQAAFDGLYRGVDTEG